MRALTLHGFLSQYVRDLSPTDTGSLYKLSKEAAANPRLREPLFLYAVSSNKADLLLQATKDDQLNAEYANMLASFDRASLFHALESGDPMLPEGYRKVYRSYVSVRDRVKTESHTKELLLQKIRRLQKEKRVTNYRIYTDLSLNHGNLSAYLKHGDLSKVSLETARRVVEYLDNAQFRH